MQFDVKLTESATQDILFFRVHDQRLITSAIIGYLKREADVETRKRKRLRPNPLAPWELRVDNFRVFYEIEADRVVKVIAVGHKEHNDLFIRGNKIDL